MFGIFSDLSVKKERNKSEKNIWYRISLKKVIDLLDSKSWPRFSINEFENNRRK